MLWVVEVLRGLWVLQSLGVLSRVGVLQGLWDVGVLQGVWVLWVCWCCGVWRCCGMWGCCGGLQAGWELLHSLVHSTVKVPGSSSHGVGGGKAGSSRRSCHSPKPSKAGITGIIL